MRRNNTEPLREVIQRYLHAIGAKQKIKEIQLKNSWDRLMGTNISEQTEYIFIKRGIFHVKLSSPIVKHELLMMKSVIIQRLNNIAKETIINDIVFL